MKKVVVKSDNILVGLDNIQDFLTVSKPTLQKLKDSGLPIAKIEGSWYATKANLEAFFDRKTRIDPRLESFLRKE